MDQTYCAPTFLHLKLRIHIHLLMPSFLPRRWPIQLIYCSRPVQSTTTVPLGRGMCRHLTPPEAYLHILHCYGALTFLKQCVFFWTTLYSAKKLVKVQLMNARKAAKVTGLEL